MQNSTRATRKQENSPVITPEQLLVELGGAVSRSLLYKALRAGEIPSRRLGRRILIPRRQFEEWLHGSGGQPEAGGDR